MPITKPGQNKWVKALIFAPSNQGKTHLLGTAQADPRTKPMLLLDFEGGDSTLEGLDIDMERIRSWDDWTRVYYELTEGAYKGRYKSVGIDSASEIHNFALDTILVEMASRRTDPDALQQGDYGKAGIQIRRLLRRFRDLPMHVFFTALAKEASEPREGLVKKPDMKGQMSEDIVAIMDVVGYLALETRADKPSETQRVLLLKNYPKFRIKVRTPWGMETETPDEIEDPTITKLLDVLKVTDTGVFSQMFKDDGKTAPPSVVQDTKEKK